LDSKALHAYDFADEKIGGPRNEPVIIPDRKGGAALEMRDGAHLGLVLAVQHEWRHCPGVTYQLPEAVCGSEPSHAHGTCYKPRGTRDQRDEVSSEREKGFECECHAGYRKVPPRPRPSPSPLSLFYVVAHHYCLGCFRVVHGRVPRRLQESLLRPRSLCRRHRSYRELGGTKLKRVECYTSWY
jgi:hypothetical protein